MTINEFLIELEQALDKEIPVNEVRSNLKYYQGYMQEQIASKTESEIIEELGDPRLIARTIIDTYQLNHGNGKHYSYNSSANQDYYSNSSNSSTDDQGQASYNTQNNESNHRRKSNGQSFRMPNWLMIIILIFMLIIVLNIVFWVGSIAFRIFFRFGLPILLFYLVITLIRNRRR